MTAIATDLTIGWSVRWSCHTCASCYDSMCQVFLLWFVFTISPVLDVLLTLAIIAFLDKDELATFGDQNGKW